LLPPQGEELGNFQGEEDDSYPLHSICLTQAARRAPQEAYMRRNAECTALPPGGRYV